MVKSLIPIEDLDLDEPTQKAVELVRGGIPVVYAADTAGADVALVAKAADAAGLLDTGEEALESLTSRIAIKAGIRLESLIDDPNEKLTAHALGVTLGINTDKFVKLGELKVKRAAGSSDRLGAAAQLLAKLHAGGGGKITVEVAPVDPASQAIDVTPTEIEP